jgi:general stress protein YciG
MAGTKDGGLRAASTNKERHGEDFYKTIGAMGGKNSREGGFYSNRELARLAGQKGGQQASTPEGRAKRAEAMRKRWAEGAFANRKPRTKKS